MSTIYRPGPGWEATLKPRIGWSRARVTHHLSICAWRHCLGPLPHAPPPRCIRRAGRGKAVIAQRIAQYNGSCRGIWKGATTLGSFACELNACEGLVPKLINYWRACSGGTAADWRVEETLRPLKGCGDVEAPHTAHSVFATRVAPLHRARTCLLGITTRSV
eukprot:6195631-Pleurochrysis_carterae.AAC.2